jgi:[ribosomal protein S5]-alanine N-acetyltransferase
MTELIKTPRLELVLMTVPFMEALQRRDLEAAARELDASVPMWMAEELQDFLNHRLGQLATQPETREWLGRAMVLTDEDGARHAVGSIGFHGPPDEKGRLEIGYSVDPPYRRRGFAREAATAMYDWAYRTKGVTTFVASVSPDNIASLNLIEEYGYAIIGEQMDEIDGLELVFETTWPPSTSA